MPDFVRADTATDAVLSLGTSVYGTIETIGDHDWYRVDLVAGRTYEFRLHGMGIDQITDPDLRLRDAGGNEIARNDDNGPWGGQNAQDSRIVYTATTSGTYYVDASTYLDVNGQPPDPSDRTTGEFLLTAVEANPNGMVFTSDEIAWQLIDNGEAHFGDPPAAFNIGSDGALTVNFADLTAQGRTLAIAALQAWTDVTGINFIETTATAEIMFYDSGSDAYADINNTDSLITSSYVNVGAGFLSSYGAGFNRYSFETYIHEIGHALGFGHGGNYNGSAVYGQSNYYLNDSLAYSIMSYMQAQGDQFGGSIVNTFVDADFRYMLTPAIADIIAIQNLYGDQIQTATRLGDTIYGYGSNTGNAALDAAVLFGTDMFMCIYDDGGVDFLNFAQASVDQVINLNDESFSNVLGGRMNLSIARGTVIENAIGGSGSDTLIGNEVANYLDGNAGADRMSGGGGDDTYVVDDAGDVVEELAENGTNDQVNTILATYTLTANVEFLDYLGPSFQNFTGTGNDLDNTIQGWNGNDRLDGGAGQDLMRGYGGDDTFVVDNAGDQVVENAGGGTDWVETTLTSYTLAANVENVNYLGDFSLDFRGIGNDLDNTILGWNGNDTLNGRIGADIMRGYSGNDTYVIDNVNDQVLEYSGGGSADRVNASISYTLATGVQIEILGTTSLAGTTAINLTGNEFVQTLYGNGGANVIKGAGGADLSYGYGGDDTYIVDNVNDKVFEAAGGGTADRVNASTTYALAAGQQVEILSTTAAAGTGAINLTGNEFSQTVYGNAGANYLNGLGGPDLLYGFGGNDFFSFTTARGTDNIDRIADFSAADDTIRLAKGIFSALNVGTLSDAAYKDIGDEGATVDLDDRILYNDDNGALYYDTNGSQDGGRLHFATLANRPDTLTGADFVVVA